MQQDSFAVVITQNLGRVFSNNPDVNVVGAPLGNSTKWVFDVEQDTQKTSSFGFQLRGWRNQEILASIVSIGLTPLSSSFWDAKPYVSWPWVPNLSITTQKTQEPVRYRVVIDLVHSTSR